MFGRYSSDIDSRNAKALCDGGWIGSGFSNKGFENRFLRHRTLLGNLRSRSLADASIRDFDDLPDLLHHRTVIGQAIDVLVQDGRRVFRGGCGNNENSVRCYQTEESRFIAGDCRRLLVEFAEDGSTNQ